MATHASDNSDMSIVYFSLTINVKKKIIKAEKSKTIGEIVKSQLTQGYMLYKTLLWVFHYVTILLILLLL